MAYSQNFLFIIKETANFEGGYQAFAQDNANYTSTRKLVGTNRGISAIAYEQYLGYEPTIAMVKAITPDIATAVYYKLFWLPILGDKIKELAVAWVIFDSFIATGNLKLVRKSINKLSVKKVVSSNTKFNQYTIDVINAINPKKLVIQIILDNIAQRTAIGNTKFIKGWINRLNVLKSKALSLINDQNKGKSSTIALLILGFIAYKAINSN